MRLYRGQLNRIAQDVIGTLRRDNDLEIGDANVGEAVKDVEAVMDQYLKTDYKILEEAKDLVDVRGLTHSDVGRVRRELAERYGHPMGESGVRWIIGQIVEGFMVSRFVDEVFADDQKLRRKIMEIFKKHMVDDDVLDREVRDRLKNIQEGSAAWSIQYQKTMREVRRRHGLES